MLKKRTNAAYWESFAQYQSFTSVEAMFETVSYLERTYTLSDTIKSVLNTIKLHAQTYYGVCWLKREEIAIKAQVSLSSVKRAIRILKEANVIEVIPQKHTIKGCDAPNVYIIQNIVGGAESHDPVDEPVSEPLHEPVDEPHNNNPYSNSNTDLNINSNNFNDKFENNRIHNQLCEDEILSKIPEEFIQIMRPYYIDNPEVISQRWKSTCVAIKKTCFTLDNTKWETIAYSWKIAVNKYKKNKITKARSNIQNVDDAIGGYYYSVLCEHLLKDYLDLIWERDA